MKGHGIAVRNFGIKKGVIRVHPVGHLREGCSGCVSESGFRRMGVMRGVRGVNIGALHGNEKPVSGLDCNGWNANAEVSKNGLTAALKL